MPIQISMRVCPNTFKDGDIIKAEDFNNNNLSIKKAINDIPAGATGPAGPKGDTGATGLLVLLDPRRYRCPGPAGADSTVPGPQGDAGANGA